MSDLLPADVAHVAHVQESFDPIIDVGTGQDLVPAMVYAQALGDWDFTGMLTLILYHQVVHPCHPPLVA